MLLNRFPAVADAHFKNGQRIQLAPAVVIQLVGRGHDLTDVRLNDFVVR